MLQLRSKDDFTKGLPGAYANIPHEEYALLRAKNASSLKHFFRSPLYFKYKQDNPSPDTSSLSLGRATHTAVFEPEKFKAYIVMPKFDGRTKDGKEGRAKWLSENEGKIIIESDEFNSAIAIRDACIKHPMANKLLNFASQNELSIVWTDPDTGLLCKGRIDRLVTMNYGKDKDGNDIIEDAILDLKTTQDCSPEVFTKDIFKYRYYFSLAFYLNGLSVLTGKTQKRAIIIAAESPAPNDVCCYQLSQDFIDNGIRQVGEFLKKYKQCSESGIWDGIDPNNISPIMPNLWMFPAN